MTPPDLLPSTDALGEAGAVLIRSIKLPVRTNEGLLGGCRACGACAATAAAAAAASFLDAVSSPSFGTPPSRSIALLPTAVPACMETSCSNLLAACTEYSK